MILPRSVPQRTPTPSSAPRTARNRSRALLRLAAFLVAGLLPQLSFAAPSCTVSALPLAFGSYDTINSLSGFTSITVSCSRINQGGGTVTYTLALSTGPGSYAARQMTSGANVLLYNLYSDPTHTQVWGDGTGGSVTVAGTFSSPPKSQTAAVTVYGLIPGAQNVVPGAYATATPITVTITY